MSHSIFDAFPIVAQALGESRGVRVQFQHSDAYTDGRVINIPPFDAETAPQGVIRKAWGYLDHESFHVLLTDFQAYSRGAMALWQESYLGPSLLNVLEDVRIEAKGREYYPGARRNLDQVVQQGCTEGFLAWPEDDWDSPDLVQAYLLYGLRYQILGQDVLATRAQQAEGLLVSRHGRALVERIDAAVAPIRQAQSTADVVAIADQLLKELKQAQPPRPEPEASDEASSPEPEASGSGDASGDSETSPAASDEDAQGDEDSSSAASGGDGTESAEAEEGSHSASGSDAESPAGDPTSAGPPESGQDQAAQSAQAEADREASTLDASVEDEAAGAEKSSEIAGEPQLSLDLYGQIAEEMRRQAIDDSGEVAATPIDVSSEMMLADKPDPEIEQHAKRMTARLRGWLAGMLEAQAREHRRRQSRGRRVKASRLHRLQLGDPRVFEQRSRGRGRNTAVVVLNDISGSMRGSRYQAATIASSSVIEALDGQRGLRTAFLSFSEQGVVHRHLGERGWRVPPSAVHPEGTTKTDEAVAWAVKELRPVREDRKIVILVTDGRPDKVPTTREVIRKARKAGIEVLGVGIYLPEVQKLGCTEHRVIYDIEQLPRELFEMMQEALAPAA